MKKVELFAKIVEYVLLIIGLVLVIAAYTNTASEALVDGSATDMSIIWTAILLGIGLVLAIASTVLATASDMKGLVKMGIGLVAAAIIIGIFWSISDDTPLNLVGYEGDQNQGAWLKVSDTGIFTTYLCLGGAVVSIVVTEIYQLFR